MRRAVCLPLLIILCASLAAQDTSTRRSAVKTVIEGRPATLRLAAHRTTTIRLPDPVNSVIVGDPNLFQAEYSPDEPLLVFAKPISPTAAESNLVISTMQGRQFVLVLKSLGSVVADATIVVDLLVNCRPAAIFFIEEGFPSVLISVTSDMASTGVSGVGSDSTESGPATPNPLVLDDLMRRQGQQPLRNLT